jgi:DNA-binding transcriptional LysR family regulator
MEPAWEWYRSFLSVLETGSLSAAARAMGLTQPTLGRHIDGLERALGLKLFTRSLHGYAPTQAALELRPYAVGLANTAAALRRAASSHGTGVRGTVRITTSEVIGVEVLPPILAGLHEAQPDLTVELVLSNQVDDLLHRAADIAVRMLRPTQHALVARRLGGIELGLHAQRRYLDAHGRPKTLADLERHALVGFDRETELIRRLQARFGAFERASLAFRADSDLAQLSAIRAGLGIGVCQVALAKRDPGLVRVLPRQFSVELDTWLAMHEDLRTSPRCAVTFAALAAGITAYIEGRPVRRGAAGRASAPR